MTWEGTDNLRCFAKTCAAECDEDTLSGIADRIDEAHRAECETNYTAGFSMGISSEDIEDEDLAELGLMRIDPNEEDIKNAYDRGFDAGAAIAKSWVDQPEADDELAEHGLMRIEAHERAMQDMRDDFNRAEEKERNSTLRDWLHLTSNGELEALGYTRLPVDADGKPWHVGDMAMESGRIDTVSKLVLGVDGWALALTSTVGLFEADVLRHHKPTPAERIRAVAEQVLNADTSQARIEANDALYAIADELEGGAE